MSFTFGNGGGVTQAQLEQATGWGNYSDTAYTSVSPLTLVADTDTALPNNKGSVIESQMPSDITTFYDGTVVTGRNGDGLLLTIDFKAKPTAPGTSYLEMWIDIGGAIEPLFPRLITFPKGQNEERPITATTLAYTLGTWETNGGVIHVLADGGCEIYDIRYLIARSHKAR